jgi:hypothetical protein
MNPAQCPHCRAIGTKLDDVVTLGETTLNYPYCGRCGQNWPKLPSSTAAPFRTPLEDLKR